MAWVPAANRYLVTRHVDISYLEQHPEIFSAHEQDSLMTRVMGHNMLRKDGSDHRRERKAAEPALRPRTVRQVWRPVFERLSDELIDAFVQDGQADLFGSYAGPMAALSPALMPAMAPRFLLPFLYSAYKRLNAILFGPATS